MDGLSEKSAMPTIYRRLLPFAVLSYFLAYIDRRQVTIIRKGNMTPQAFFRYAGRTGIPPCCDSALIPALQLKASRIGVPAGRCVVKAQRRWPRLITA